MGKKLHLVLVIVLLFVSIGFGRNMVSEAAAPPDPFEPSQFGIPKTIGAYKVLAVLTDTNYGCLGSERHLVLEVSSKTPQEAMQNYDSIERALADNHLTEYSGKWSIVGPGKTRGQLISQLAEGLRFAKTVGCNHKIAVPLASNGCDSSSIDIFGVHKTGFALVMNTDVSTYHDAKAQSVFLRAPSNLGTNQDSDLSAFLNNIYTNQGYFSQIGFVFYQDGSGLFAWSDNLKANECQVRSFPLISFQKGHDYWTTLTWFNTAWWQCALDTSDYAGYTCRVSTPEFTLDPNFHGDTGNHLVQNQATSIFAENHNRNLSWATGFSTPWEAYGAGIVRSADGNTYSWTSARSQIISCSKWVLTAKAAMGGSLVGGNTATWNVPAIPTSC